MIDNSLTSRRGTPSLNHHGTMPHAIGLRHIPTVLCVGLPLRDHTFRRCLANLGCRTVYVDTCTAACSLLKSSYISVIVCATNLPDGSWRDVLYSTADSAQKPVVVVTSSCADEHLWAEVLNLGGFDVLAQPFDPQELRHVVLSAHLAGSRDGRL